MFERNKWTWTWTLTGWKVKRKCTYLWALFTEAYRGLHLFCYDLYFVILFVVLSTYKLIYRFIYPNILHCIEVSLYNLNHFIVIGQFTCYLLCRLLFIYREKWWHIEQWKGIHYRNVDLHMFSFLGNILRK